MPPSSLTTPRHYGYRTFPPEFLALLERIESLRDTDTIPVGPFTKAQALAARRAFYRFRNALHEASDDPYARQMAAIAVNIAIQVKPSRDGLSWHLAFGHSPLVLGLRAALRTALAPPPSPATSPPAAVLPDGLNKEDPYA